MRVAIYCRASSDEQTASCPDQLKALRAEAKKRGLTIVAEYVDDGLSGSKSVEKRTAFLRLVADSARGEFQRVLVYDTSRFGRLDAIKAAQHKLTLRQNGCEGLLSLSEGEVLWTTSMGRMVDSLMSEANHETALKISRSSIRGRISQLEQKVYPHGMIPYGYSRQYEGNGQTILVRRDENFRMPDGWTRKLVVNEAEAEVVRRIYRLFLAGQSLLSIMRTLTDEEVPAWKGGQWKWDVVRKIIGDKSYIGVAVMGKATVKKKEVHNRIPVQEIPGMLPSLVDDQTWHDAQRLLQGRGGFGQTRSEDAEPRVLSGVLVCAKCGYRLVGRSRSKRSGAVKEQGAYYSCCSSTRRGSSCPQWRAYEKELLPTIVQEVVKILDAEVLASLAPRQEGEDKAVETLTKTVATLKEQTKRAVMRAAVADDELAEEFREVAVELKAELGRAEERLRLAKHVEKEGGPVAWADWWFQARLRMVLSDPNSGDEFLQALEKYPAIAKAAGSWGGMGKPMGAQEVETLRAVLARLGCSVQLFWVPNPAKKKSQDAKWVLDRARISVDFKWSAHSAPTTISCRDIGMRGLQTTVEVRFRV